MTGPYQIVNKLLAYSGNSIFPPVSDDSHLNNASVHKSEGDLFHRLTSHPGRATALISIYDHIHGHVAEFMSAAGTKLFNLPTLTRMISSPGALTGTIPTDVDPFRVPFFGREMFLTQSSQLFLEIALLVSGIEDLYCFEKSFRNEHSDFRHLPEFTHVEYEGARDFEQILSHQENFLRNLVLNLCSNQKSSLRQFLSEDEILDLTEAVNRPFIRM